MQFLMFAILAFGVVSIFKRNGAWVVIAIFALVCFNDFILVQSSEDSVVTVVDRFWKEIFFTSLVVVYLLRRRGGRLRRFEPDRLFVNRMIALVILSSFYGIVVGLSGGVYESIVAWRRYFLPVLIPFLIYLNGFFYSFKYRLVFYWCNAIALLMAVYAIWSYFAFNGDYTSVWYYDFIAGAKENAGDAERLVQYQIVRDDALRASGFFVSPIEFSMFMALLSSLSICSFFMLRPTRLRALSGLFFLIYLAALYYSNVRAGVLVLFLTLFGVALTLRQSKVSVWKLIGAPIVLTVVTFASFVYAVDLDESALGRLVQYASLLTDFRPLGYGLIAPDVGSLTYRDSWYLSVLGVFGVFAPVYMLVGFLPIFLSAKVARDSLTTTNRMARPFFAVAVGFGFSLIYLFAFHHSVGASYVYFLYIFIFMCLSGANGISIQQAERRVFK